MEIGLMEGLMVGLKVSAITIICVILGCICEVEERAEIKRYNESLKKGK